MATDDNKDSRFFGGLFLWVVGLILAIVGWTVFGTNGYTDTRREFTKMRVDSSRCLNKSECLLIPKQVGFKFVNFACVIK